MPLDLDTMQGGFAGGTLASALWGTIFIVFLLVFAIYWVYTSFAWKEIGRKVKYKKDWLAWIPFARTAMILQMGDFHWAFVFLWLIPLLGWIPLGILIIIATWRIFEARKYPGWLALIPIISILPYIGYLAGIAHLVILGLVAWKDQ